MEEGSSGNKDLGFFWGQKFMELWSGEPRVVGGTPREMHIISCYPPGIHKVSEPLKAAQHSAQVSEGPGSDLT